MPFPFSALSHAKRRPALVVAELEGDDIILCQITSQKLYDKYSIVLSDTDFESGGLRRKSHIRPNRLFTADTRLILYRAGHLKPEKLKEVIERIIEILTL